MTFGMTAETLLVHGGGLEILPGSIRLSEASTARAYKAIDCYYNLHADNIVFSGGNAHGDLLSTSEAGMMADIAVAEGVNHKRITVEDTSSSTIGNWSNSVPIITELGESVIGITSRVASLRARMIAKKLISNYGLEFTLEGYICSTESEGSIAYPREISSSALAIACLHRAQKQEVELKDLNDYFVRFKKTAGLDAIKRHITT